MDSKFLFATVLAVFISSAYCATCTSPEVTIKTFTTQDATIVSSIAYITEFGITCASGSLTNLYADLDGNVVPVSIVGNNKYQISWTEEIKTARSGEQTVRLFDEDGYNAFRKAARAGEDTSTIPAFVNIGVHHPGAFNGPWFKSEFLAAVLSIMVAYLAFSSRSKLLA